MALNRNHKCFSLALARTASTDLVSYSERGGSREGGPSGAGLGWGRSGR